MRRPTNDMFVFKDITLEVIPQQVCKGCYFSEKDCITYLPIRGKCHGTKKHPSVIFKEVKHAN